MDPCHGAAIIKICQWRDGKVEGKRDTSCHTEDTSKMSSAEACAGAETRSCMFIDFFYLLSPAIISPRISEGSIISTSNTAPKSCQTAWAL